MRREFQRVAIVNRGEAAMRFIHAAREFNQEHGTALCTIALFTDPDRHAMFVREADEAVSLGEAQIIDPDTHQAKSSYVDYGRLERALVAARAEAAWVGWGFVAEHAEFADLCRDLGIVFIGPDGEVIRRLGDKITSKRMAEEARIPVAPWSGGPVETLADAWRHAERLGYPLLIKATAGGGGHGIRRVRSPSDLEKAFESARAEAFKAFGNPTVFLEQLVLGARHVEVQIIADDYGTTWAAGVRDCTIQRRHQKILEEAPSPVLSPEQDEALREAAVRLSQAAGYRNAGTVEFLYQPETRGLSFMEMNTRLQVEHPVTECTTGLDLVKLQIHVARGGRLEGSAPRTTGHAIEVRLNAEDPDNGFAPAPGVIERFRILTGPGVRVDTGVAEGDTVPAEFDSMIAKIIAYGQTRKEALARLQRALRESVVVIRGGASNKSFLLELLNRAEVRRAEADIGWMDRLAASGEHVSRHYADVALLQAAIEVYNAELAVEQTQFYAAAVRGRPHVSSELGRIVELRYRGNSYSLMVSRLGPQQYRVEVDGSRIEAEIDRLGQFEYWFTSLGRRFRIVSVFQGLNYRIEVDGVSHRIDRDDGAVHAPSPAVVVSIAVKPGDMVSMGDPLVVLEAMKMEMQVVAPFSGRIRKVMIIPYVQVDAGASLVQIESTPAGAAAADTERVVFGASLASNENRETIPAPWRQNLKELRQLMLGFDVGPVRTTELIAEWSQFDVGPASKDEITRGEDEILNIFVDICSLFQSQPDVEDSTSGEGPSAEAHLFSYLRALDTRGEGLPVAFVDALRRALTHYGVRTLDRSAELEESLLWLYKSHQRVEQQLAPVLGVLERRLEQAETLASHAEESFRALLDRMIAVARGLFPAVSDLAREVRYRCFDQPLFDRARARIYAQVDEHLDYIAAHPDAAGRRGRMHELVECPQPLATLFLRRFANADSALRQFMLEALTGRYYRIRTLKESRCLDLDGQGLVSAEFDQEGKRIHVFTTHAEYSQLLSAARAVFPLLEQVPQDHDIVIDFYAQSLQPLGDPETTQQEVHALLNRTGFPRPVRRILVAIAGPDGGHGMSAMQHFTFRPSGGALVEDKIVRGLHPMMAKRLQLWRLKNFKLERLPSVEDVYLYRGVAYDNPKDERLLACVEVRDLTPVRDEQGRIVQLPHLERMFTEALAGIRLFQSRRSPQERLHWNRILLYVWPTLNLKPDEIHDIVQKLAPATEGLGLEQVVLRARVPNPDTGELREMVIRISTPSGAGFLITFRPATTLQPMKPLSEYHQKVIRMRRRGLLYPYEIVKTLTPDREDMQAEFPPGDFIEHDLNPAGRLIPVDRPHGQNKANIVVGIIRNFTNKYPEGMRRVLLLGDPSKDLGAVAEPECRRILAALDLAGENSLPVEWFPVSAGAKISMDSGVENMDWIARVLRRLIEFTQAGGEVNLLVNGINVGAQPYWNAEATMLMHTRGILVMTPKASMVLTGKHALDYSGGVSAEDNQGIGGYDRIMGPNGQAQYWARDIDEACHILLRHYEHTYIAPGERFPRPAETTDPIGRDVRTYPHAKGGEDGFALVGDIFSDETNPGRKKSFDIRKVMLAVIDQDHLPLERWAGTRSAETAVIWDAHLGGYPVCLAGIESRPVPRIGFVPADGPNEWSAGTLFPLSSRKVARAINAASGNRPMVLLANLSGFDGSPESLRKLQLEYGAEIGRAVVNFKGPMVFCVISRYHGGAYVVFSQALNEHLEVAALEGTFASVIGGAPAAAVVFASEVESRTRKDARLEALGEALGQAAGLEKRRLRTQWNELFKVVRSEKLGEVADEFDRVHSVQRALSVGALHHIIPPANLRPYLIDAVERGLKRYAGVALPPALNSTLETSPKERAAKV
ncbi:MAG TPA: carboxyl transferase domain-containing protein [Bryobacteraceae bacterium]|nr:carboxyl transferase domain-containing protein [Bryobacteraceae bacterium]